MFDPVLSEIIGKDRIGDDLPGLRFKDYVPLLMICRLSASGLIAETGIESPWLINSDLLQAG